MQIKQVTKQVTAQSNFLVQLVIKMQILRKTVIYILGIHQDERIFE